jgi:hypothetical protein
MPRPAAILIQRIQATSLIWNDSPSSHRRALVVVDAIGKRPLADRIRDFVRRRARGPGAPQAPPVGREALDAVSVV